MVCPARRPAPPPPSSMRLESVRKKSVHYLSKSHKPSEGTYDYDMNLTLQVIHFELRVHLLEQLADCVLVANWSAATVDEAVSEF